MSLERFLIFDFPALLCAVSACVACALLGSILVLRRQSLMGDALAHAVLPGIVISFLISGSQKIMPVFIGAIIAAFIASILISYLEEQVKFSASTAMGVVFSFFYALGIFLMEVAAGQNVDLDPNCLLYGQLETIFWTENLSTSYSHLSLLDNLSFMPAEVYSSLAVLLLSIVFIVICYKEILISSFDAQFAALQGSKPRFLTFLLMGLVSAAIVVSFQVLGSILVIALLICPGVCARFYTDKLNYHILISCSAAILMVLLGYFFAVYVPEFFNISSLNAAGGISFFAGIVLLISICFAPKYGVIFQIKRRKSLALKVSMEDILGLLYRLFETKENVTESELKNFFLDNSLFSKSLTHLYSMGHLKNFDQHLVLTDSGISAGQALVRKHRLWENYLVSKVGLRSDHVHETAMHVEHFTSSEIEEKLATEQENTHTDPHGKPIP